MPKIHTVGKLDNPLVTDGCKATDDNIQAYWEALKESDSSSSRKEAIDKALGYIHAITHYGLITNEEADTLEEKFTNLLGEQIDYDIFTNECENKNIKLALTIIKDIYIKPDGSTHSI